MVNRLIGETVVRQGVKAADSGEQWPVFFSPNFINPLLQPLPGTGRHVGQSLLVSLTQHKKRSLISDNVTQIQANGLRSSQTATENDGQHRRIADADTGIIGLTGSKQRTDLLRRQGTTARETAAAQVTHRPDVLEALDIHELQHPGFLRHPLQRRKIGVDRGRGPAGVAQQFGHGHHVVAPQAAPAAGLQGSGSEHAGDNTEERGHGLPAAGGVEGQQVGPGGTDRSVLTGQRWQEFLTEWHDGCGQTKLRFVVGHQDHVGLRPGRKGTGALSEKSGEMIPSERTAKSLLFQTYILISKQKN